MGPNLIQLIFFWEEEERSLTLSPCPAPSPQERLYEVTWEGSLWTRKRVLTRTWLFWPPDFRSPASTTVKKIFFFCCLSQEGCGIVFYGSLSWLTELFIMFIPCDSLKIITDHYPPLPLTAGIEVPPSWAWACLSNLFGKRDAREVMFWNFPNLTIRRSLIVFSQFLLEYSLWGNVATM